MEKKKKKRKLDFLAMDLRCAIIHSYHLQHLRHELDLHPVLWLSSKWYMPSFQVALESPLLSVGND